MAEVETSHINATSISSFLQIDQSIVDSALTQGLFVLLQQVQIKAVEFEQLRNSNEVLKVNHGI